MKTRNCANWTIISRTSLCFTIEFKQEMRHWVTSKVCVARGHEQKNVGQLCAKYSFSVYKIPSFAIFRNCFEFCNMLSPWLLGKYFLFCCGLYFWYRFRWIWNPCCKIHSTYCAAVITPCVRQDTACDTQDPWWLVMIISPCHVQ